MTYGEELISHIWPLALFLVMLCGLIVLMLTLPALLGGRRVSRAVNEPYECGIVPVGSTHFRMPIPFYLFAIFFVIFDLEVVFLLLGQWRLRKLAGSVLLKPLSLSSFCLPHSFTCGALAHWIGVLKDKSSTYATWTHVNCWIFNLGHQHPPCIK